MERKREEKKHEKEKKRSAKRDEARKEDPSVVIHDEELEYFEEDLTTSTKGSSPAREDAKKEAEAETAITRRVLYMEYNTDDN